jgi:hypothetical protein
MAFPWRTLRETGRFSNAMYAKKIRLAMLKNAAFVSPTPMQQKTIAWFTIDGVITYRKSKRLKPQRNVCSRYPGKVVTPSSTSQNQIYN